MKKISLLLFVGLFGLIFSSKAYSQTILLQNEEPVSIQKAKNAPGSTKVEIDLSNGKKIVVDFYGENIFRLFYDQNDGELRDPQGTPPANILVNNPRKSVKSIQIDEKQANKLIIRSEALALEFDKNSLKFKITNLNTKRTVVESTSPLQLQSTKWELGLKAKTNEYFYGGGVQNGRFSHKGKAIAIENQNSWTDGGVASPTPFYWSTAGYGFMGYTFKKGVYDFESKEEGSVNLSHESDYFDAFFMVNDGLVALLNDFYQLTGYPVLIPKMGFYQGHLNAYNRDYWVEDSTGILFEDGKRYKENQKDNGGIKESLNGEKGNYQFSARAVVDRYKNHDMPLGWILPNDGYGAGYGQTSTLEGNIQNLKEFGDYARNHGVEIGLWTQSDLHPKEGIEPLLQRDIINEVGVAGVKVLKTDVAWVGPGYSFGLNGVQDVANIMPKHGNGTRPFIISLDGWAGTQHYATIWTGDQTGGVWEYIRFHIPTYIGSGLSGQPNISSDMDGIFGGKNPAVNIRDYQWKTFTLMQLNMDGWGSNPKYPHALDEPATSINRNYLKLKSELLPYQYSVAHESVAGEPSIRAMFLEEENPFTLGKNTQYQYMYGPSFLIAPIYQETEADEEGNDIRDNIYLPKGTWYDYFSGQKFEGNRIINNVDYPIWKLPVFVKEGAIIPMVNPNNNPNEIDKSHRIFEIYPSSKSSFTLYDDDGESVDYLKGASTKTVINSYLVGDIANIEILPTTGDFKGFVKEQSTEFRINVSKEPKKPFVTVNGKKQKLKKAKSLEDFKARNNVYYYDAAPNLNQFATKGSEFESVKITKNPQLLVKVAQSDITKGKTTLTIKGFKFEQASELLKTNGTLSKIQNIEVVDSNATAYTLKPSWSRVANADYYEFELDGMRYSTITNESFLFENLVPETKYDFKARAVNKDGASEWISFSATTKSDPLEFALRGLTAESNKPMQGGHAMNRLFDFDEGNMLHSKYGEDALPFEMIIDLHSISQLDKLIYLPRNSGKNGMIETVKISHSMDKNNWNAIGEYEWVTDFSEKTVNIEDKPTARYIKLEVSKAVGNFVSGRELYVFKVANTESYLPGDINNDKKVDHNDLTSYMNYTGLRLGDGDFEGYVSRGDVNFNNIIDAFDISNAATQLDGGVSLRGSSEPLNGKLTFTSNKTNYRAGEIVEITVSGEDLQSVNALGFNIPYSVNDYDFVGIKTIGTKEMQNFTNDRLHSDGEKVLYPTFVNVGNKETIEGSGELFLIQLKAKRNLKFNLEAKQGLLVDKRLNSIQF